MAAFFETPSILVLKHVQSSISICISENLYFQSSTRIIFYNNILLQTTFCYIESVSNSTNKMIYIVHFFIAVINKALLFWLSIDFLFIESEAGGGGVTSSVNVLLSGRGVFLLLVSKWQLTWEGGRMVYQKQLNQVIYSTHWIPCWF